MSVEVFIPYRPQARARDIIEQANIIVNAHSEHLALAALAANKKPRGDNSRGCCDRSR
jgi:hypothetical protein